MKRRHFVAMGAAGAALAAWPPWLARAFDPAASCGAGERLEALFDSYRAARRSGKPLLVLIIPELDEHKWERGTLFGQVFNHGADETLAMLGLVTLACATASELARLVELETGDDPLFVTIDTARRPARTRAHRVELSQSPEFVRSGDWEASARAIDRAIDAQIDALGAALRSAIAEAVAAVAPDAPSFEAERVARAIAAGDAVASADVLQAALALHRRAAALPAERSQLITALAAAVREEVIARPIAGSVWGLSYGCGTQIEGRPDDHCIACGMGHVPAKSSRFLYFFARLPCES